MKKAGGAVCQGRGGIETECERRVRDTQRGEQKEGNRKYMLPLLPPHFKFLDLIAFRKLVLILRRHFALPRKERHL